MFIFDLITAMFSILVVVVAGIVITRKVHKIKNPPPSVQEKIEYYEALNEQLRREMEV